MQISNFPDILCKINFREKSEKIMKQKNRGGWEAKDFSFKSISPKSSATSVPGMEDKTPPPSSSKPSYDFGPSETLSVPEPPRRRQGGNKRKSLSTLTSASSFSAAKRLAKERNNPHALLPPVHSGPVTRARQSPVKLAAAAAAAGDVGRDQGVWNERDGVVRVDACEEEEVVMAEQPVVDTEFEDVRSREKSVHVVPTHAGWFSWENVHPLEERTLVSFFNGKLENRTSDIYVEIRNSIMKKFREDPQKEIELNDLAEIDAGDSDGRQEVMEFLDHWGLINFHPFPPSSSEISAAPENDKAAKTASLLQKLYQFETVEAPCNMTVKRLGSSMPTAPMAGLLPESSLVEDLTRPVEPSVEYHCNSCSGDCSRKRYHCQKQADFDLCSECYTAEKFGPGMVSIDFILMESAEVRGVSGGSWTDQETLLLLEALELYGENWNEIAEHVATKTKAQCILHFIQMPIEDSFLDGSENLDGIQSRNKDPDIRNKDNTASDVPEAHGVKNAEEANQPATSSNEHLEKNGSSETQLDAKGSSPSIIVDALKTALQSVDYLSENEESLSFAESGNPVMALAAFFAGIVEPDAATISTWSSLKAISEDSPGIQLATRHCFPLEGPPSVSKDSPSPNSDEIEKVENQKATTNGSDEREITDDEGKKLVEAKKGLSGSSQKSSVNQNNKENSDPVLPGIDVASDAAKESVDISVPAEEVECIVPKDSGISYAPGQRIADTVEASKNLTSQEGTTSTSPLCDTKGSPELVGDEKRKIVKNCHGIISSENVKECLDTSKLVDEPSGSVRHNVKDLPHNSETKEIAGNEDNKVVQGNSNQKNNSVETGDERSLNRIRRAAITSLSAAAVKAKLFSKHEEDQIRHLASMIIEKQLQKLENKVAMFMDIEGMIMRVKEQLDRARKKVYIERAQIIAARFGGPPSRPPNMTLQKPPPRRI